MYRPPFSLSCRALTPRATHFRRDEDCPFSFPHYTHHQKPSHNILPGPILVSLHHRKPSQIPRSGAKGTLLCIMHA